MPRCPEAGTSCGHHKPRSPGPSLVSVVGITFGAVCAEKRGYAHRLHGPSAPTLGSYLTAEALTELWLGAKFTLYTLNGTTSPQLSF